MVVKVDIPFLFCLKFISKSMYSYSLFVNLLIKTYLGTMSINLFKFKFKQFDFSTYFVFE